MAKSLKTEEAVVLWPYEAKNIDELSLNEGDIISDVEQVEEGWCEGLLNGKRGMFPENFVHFRPVSSSKPAAPVSGEQSNANMSGSSALKEKPPSKPQEKQVDRAKVLFNYYAMRPDELSIRVGAVVEIVSKDKEEGWWEVRQGDQTGLIPNSYVQLLPPKLNKPPAPSAKTKSVPPVLMNKPSAAPLTPEAVTDAVKDVKWDDLCQCLYVPDSKCNEIKTHYPPEDHRRVLVDWWFSTDPAPSWRRLIHRLDYWGEDHSSCSRIADKIRHNAEAVEDPTFTLHNITAAIGTVRDWVGLCAYLEVHVRSISREEFVQYYITTVPNASWQTLAGCLYCRKEHVALEIVTRYFRRQPEATLTAANLCGALEDMVEWDRLGCLLDVPFSTLRNIEEKYSNGPRRKRAMLAEWQSYHPAPSWMLVANALYRVLIRGDYGKYHKALQLVKEKYLKAAATLPGQAVSSINTPPTTSTSFRKELDALSAPQRGAVISPPSPRSPLASPVGTLQSNLSKLSLVDIEYSDLEIMEKVGSGGFGTVSKGRWISKNKVVAIKTMVELEEREVRILSSLDHPSIIQYYGTARESNLNFIVTEFAENGSIHDYLHRDHKQPPLSQILLWATQVAECTVMAGMVYLHQRDIIHRDLKSSNVVLTSTLKAKICDLGSARSLEHTTRQTTAIGTYAWMAPEMLRREKVSKSCDVYSYGVLVFEMATQQVPFPDVIPIVAAVMTMEGK